VTLPLLAFQNIGGIVIAATHTEDSRATRMVQHAGRRDFQIHVVTILPTGEIFINHVVDITIIKTTQVQE
jgi:hypothetical protein